MKTNCQHDDDGNLYRITLRDGHIVMILAHDPVKAGSHFKPDQILSIELLKENIRLKSNGRIETLEPWDLDL